MAAGYDQFLLTGFECVFNGTDAFFTVTQNKVLSHTCTTPLLLSSAGGWRLIVSMTDLSRNVVHLAWQEVETESDRWSEQRQALCLILDNSDQMKARFDHFLGLVDWVKYHILIRWTYRACQNAPSCLTLWDLRRISLDCIARKQWEMNVNLLDGFSTF